MMTFTVLLVMRMQFRILESIGVIILLFESLILMVVASADPLFMSTWYT